LPEGDSDFIFANICEELGIAEPRWSSHCSGTLIWAGFSVMRREKDPVLRLFTMGSWRPSVSRR